jgi:23S rRNA pseudouridine1911/1915/1917 synthase
MTLKYTINNNDNYVNLHELLKNHFQISDRLLVKLKHEQKLFINGEKVTIRAPLSKGDYVEINLDFLEDNSNIVPTKMNLDILFEDDSMLIINKPAKVPVHPSMDHFEDSLSNGVRFYFDEIGLKRKIRPVNRLDKDTSGIVIFAKNEYVQECLVRQMKSNQFVKEYIAVCSGVFQKHNGTIDAPIARKENSIIERCVAEAGDRAITHYEVLKNTNDYSVVKCILETGRTHQIRVHLAYIGHPLLGDTLYGTPSPLIHRQALHAYKVKFIHPISLKPIELTTKIPNDIENIL